MAPQFSISPEKEASMPQYLYRQLLGRTAPLSRREADLGGKTAIVTGSNVGLGLEVARQLLDLGLGRLVMAVRTVSRGEEAARRLLEGRPAGACRIDVWPLDLASYKSIGDFADRARTLDRLDMAVLNAGVFKADEAFDPASGFEESVQVNYLSNALLMALLLPALRPRAAGSGPGRLVLLSSDTSGWVAFRERSARPLLATYKQPAAKWDMQERYGTSKLLGQLFLTELARRVPPSAVTVDAVNPGFCYGTDLQRDGKGTLLGFVLKIFTRIIGKPAQKGALGIVHAAVSFGQEVHGQYVEDGEIRPMAPIIYKPEGEEVAKVLWEETMKELSFAPIQEAIQEVNN
ncbi:hypothetical protein CDD83_2751 [Cordyceps sp. RAO-2017]|nr:hypothetical protein CDD83_2751 [Cordyceps sp. RAO-2017]